MLGSKVDWPKSAQVLFDDSSSMEDDRLSFGQNDYLPGTSVTQATHALPEGLTLFHPSGSRESKHSRVQLHKLIHLIALVEQGQSSIAFQMNSSTEYDIDGAVLPLIDHRDTMFVQLECVHTNQLCKATSH